MRYGSSTLRQSSCTECTLEAAEWLFADHALDGVCLRQIGTAAGSGNHDAVRYHFIDADDPTQAILAVSPT